jgi:flagellar hook-associated protein 3 FlgL
MTTNFDSGTQNFLTALDRMQRRLADASQRVSSGKRIAVTSDAPDEVPALLQLKADRNRNIQIQSNLGVATTNVNAADGALAASIRLFDRARVLAAQAGNSVLDAGSRLGIVNEIQSLQEQIVAYSRTAVQGRFIFSGDQDTTPAYALDLTAANGVVQQNTSAATARIEDPAGGTFAASMTAQTIFDNRNPDGTVASDNAFAALNSLRLALVNNDPVALDTAMISLRSASYYLNSVQSFYAGVQRRIEAAVDFAASYDIGLQTQLSQKEDADVAADAVELTQVNTQLQAAFQMRALIPRRSLFDYIG